MYLLQSTFWSFFDTFWHEFAFGRRGTQVAPQECQEICFLTRFDTENLYIFDTFWHVSKPLRSQMQIVSKNCLTRGRVPTFFWHARFFTRFDTNSCTSATEWPVSENSVRKLFYAFTHFDTTTHLAAEVCKFTAGGRQIVSKKIWHVF